MDDTELSTKRFTIDGYDETVVARHIELLKEADLLSAIRSALMGYTGCRL